jgi:hypothetical protein
MKLFAVTKITLDNHQFVDVDLVPDGTQLLAEY